MFIEVTENSRAANAIIININQITKIAEYRGHLTIFVRLGPCIDEIVPVESYAKIRAMLAGKGLV